jgi:hypothetical protein
VHSIINSDFNTVFCSYVMMQTAEEELTRMYSSAHAVVARAVAAAEARAAAAEATANSMVQAAKGAQEGLKAALQVRVITVCCT